MKGFLLLISALMISDETREDVDSPLEILRAAQGAARALESVSFQFRASMYPDSVLSFYASGLKTRFEGSLPTGRHGALLEGENTVYAFDGSRYQEAGVFGKYLTSSSLPLESSGMCGPCWTPIEECYWWLCVADRDYSWGAIRDPAIWSGLEPLTDVLTEDDRHGLTFVAQSGAVITVWFDSRRSFFPVEWQIRTAAGEPRGGCKVVRFAAVECDGTIVHIPAVVHRTRWSPTEDKSDIEYVVDVRTLTVNEPLPADLFTLDPIALGSENLVDLDTGEVFDTISGQILTDAAGSNTTAVGADHKPGVRNMRWLLMANAVAALLVGGLWMRLRRRLA